MASFTKAINKALNIEEGEQQSVYLLLLQTVFLGVFLSIFDISSTAMFMDAFGEEMLSKAFLVSGLVGFALTAGYSKLQSVIPFSRLIVINLLTISLITLMLRLGFEFYPGKELIFIVFIMMGPLNLLGVVGFWGMASRLFTLRQGKRLFGLIDSGQIIGMIVISLMVPVLLNWLTDTKNLLFISAGSIIFALLIQIIISSKFNLNRSDAARGKTSDNQSLIKLFKIKYVRAMALFVILSMLAAFFMFYSFLPITKAKYSGEGEYTTFLGMFTAALMFFTLLFKTFVYSKLTKVYGLRLNLLLPPAILGLIVILAVLVGVIFGFTVESASFMLFFLLISLGRLFSVSLKSGIEVPSQKILYLSMDSSIRHRVQVAIDGMVNESAAILSGLILMILGLFDFFQTIHYLGFLVVIAVIWIVVAIRLHREYRLSLEVTLDKSKADANNEEKQERSIAGEQIENFISTPEILPSKANIMLDFARQVTPLSYPEFCKSALFSNREDISEIVLNRINSEQQFILAESVQKYVNIEKNENLKSSAEKILNQFKEKTSDSNIKTLISELVSSVYPADRVMAANILAYSKKNELSKYLIVLLRDIFPEVRIAAIKASSVVRERELIPAIVDYLGTDIYHIYAYETILSYGEEALPFVDQFFYKSGLNHRVQLQIIKYFGVVGGKQAIKLLLTKLNYFNHEIVIETCRSLNKCGYFATSVEEKAQFNLLLVDNIRIIAWNYNILLNLRDNSAFSMIYDEIEQEIKVNNDNIFLILSIAYNPQSVLHVKENLELETPEGISFALELLDMFIDESVKQLLLIIFEDISVAERVRRFQDHFPLERMEPVELLNAIINRDINWISRWGKAIAINSLDKMGKITLTNDIIAHLFNNDKLLSELAARVINRNDPKFYIDCVERLDIHKRNSLMKVLKGKDTENLLFHSVLFLSNTEPFKMIDENILLEMAEESKEVKMNHGDKLELSNISKQNDVLIVRTGSIKIKEKGSQNFELVSSGGFIPLSRFDSIENIIEANDSTILLNISFSTLCKFTNYHPMMSEFITKIV